MRGCEALATATVEVPDQVYQDKRYANRRVLYKLVTFGCFPKPQILRIVIEYSQGRLSKEKTGRIITAMPSFHTRKGEVLLWPK